MARRINGFSGSGTTGKRTYPWVEWTDGSTWEIAQGEDYDVPTENMRTNLHMKAKAIGATVESHSFNDGSTSGLRFRFSEDGDNPAREPDAALMDKLFVDSMEIYEIARLEVKIPRKDGTQQRYAAVRYKQGLDRARAKGGAEVLNFVTRTVSKPTLGFSHLANAGRRDLMLETLVLDATKLYHSLFSKDTLSNAQRRIDEYDANRRRS